MIYMEIKQIVLNIVTSEDEYSLKLKIENLLSEHYGIDIISTPQGMYSYYQKQFLIDEAKFQYQNYMGEEFKEIPELEYAVLAEMFESECDNELSPNSVWQYVIEKYLDEEDF